MFVFRAGLGVRMVIILTDPVSKGELEVGADYTIEEPATAAELALFASERASEQMAKAAAGAEFSASATKPQASA